LVLAPHPDDEIFGLAGTLIQQIQFGDKIHMVYLTDGEGSGVWPDKEEIRRNRIFLSEKVCKELSLGYEDITRLHLTDGAVPHPGQAGFRETIVKIKELIDALKPDAVFATHTLDFWPFDHVACANIAREAVNQSEHRPQLWYYWVWAWYNIRSRQIFRIKLRNLKKIDIRKQMLRKKFFTDMYLKAFTTDGKPWSGILPKSLIKTTTFHFEICERIDINEEEQYVFNK
jgi:LmbE family N-acetylglucosaminyl deacetylase